MDSSEHGLVVDGYGGHGFIFVLKYRGGLCVGIWHIRVGTLLAGIGLGFWYECMEGSLCLLGFWVFGCCSYWVVCL